MIYVVRKQNFLKTNISDPLIRTRIISFSENFT